MIPFFKVHGIGNDFVLIDGIANDLTPVDLAIFAKQVCNRKFGVGADGLLILCKGLKSAFQMLMFNPDGTSSEMCGNGIRCIAQFIRDEGYSNEATFLCETGAGVLELHVSEYRQVRVDMGPISFDPENVGFAARTEPFIDESLDVSGTEWIGTALSVGNPHVVFFVEDVSKVDLTEFGPKVENHPLFPNRINVHLAQMVERDRIIQRTWERGAGLTLACGTGACAVTAAGWKTGRSDRAVTVELPGGQLQIEINGAGHAIMSGPAETIFEGTWRATPPALK